MSYNKNLKLYVQNKNTTGKMSLYQQSAEIYQEEIDAINKKIFNGIPVEKMLNEINYIIRKTSIFKTKIKSTTLSTLQNLKNTLTYKKELAEVKVLYSDTSTELNQINNDLENTLKKIADCKRLCNSSSKKAGFKIKDILLNNNTTFKKEYMIYIRDYGVPLDGIFLEPVLKYIRDINNL